MVEGPGLASGHPHAGRPTVLPPLHPLPLDQLALSRDNLSLLDVVIPLGAGGGQPILHILRVLLGVWHGQGQGKRYQNDEQLHVAFVL